jgi:hypothetical protein
MSYSKITLEEIRQKFGIQDIVKPIFPENIVDVQPNEWLKEALRMAAKLRIRSKKARSEAIVFPILVAFKEVNQDKFMVYLGEKLNVDKELRGECEVIICKNAKASAIDTPIFCMVEAERNDMELGKPQCMAQMIGARMYNQKYGKNIETIYGCVTIGTEWLFLKLEGNEIWIDENNLLYLNQLPKILGTFQYIIDLYK